MELYLVQHGKPVPKKVNPDRPLSEEGRQDVERLASFLRGAGIIVEKVFHSGKTRSFETAQILASALGAPLSQRQGLAPLDDVRPLALEIDSSYDKTMFVGHLPHLDKLTSLLVVGEEEKGVVRFEQGGVVCLSKNEEGGWTVAWMVVPGLIGG